MNYLAIFEPITAIMAEYKAENERLVFAYEDPQGNKDARSHVHKLRGVKTKITTAHKEGKAAALTACREIDGYKNKLINEVDEMIAVHNEPLLLIEKEKHEAEMERLRVIREAKEKEERERLEEIERREAAVKAAEEKVAAEEAAKRAEENARLAKAEQLEREKHIAEEAKAKAEANAKAALEAAEKKRLADIEAEKAKAAAEIEAKELAERRHYEAEQIEKVRLEAIEKKRQENKKHQAKIHDAITTRLMELGLDVLHMKPVMEALIAGTIPHVKIEY